VAQATNATGTVTLTRRYDPWGNLLTGASTSGWAYTGREWDPETGLYDYRARYYNPKIGRFLSEDPVQVQARSLRELNAYAYVASSPVNLTDPFGLEGLASCIRRISSEVERDYCARPGTPGGNSKRRPGDYSCRQAHCVTNCRITRECPGGSATAGAASYAKELWDEAKQQTYDPKSEGYSRGDQAANKRGRICGSSPYTKGYDCEILCQ
jgi:RHS repeat-associated protein